MRRHPGAAALPAVLLTALTAALTVAGCATTTAGTPRAAQDAAPTTRASRPPEGQSRTPGPSASAEPSSGPLSGDVIADECLLSAADVSALTGKTYLDGQNVTVEKDGKQNKSCFYTKDGDFAPSARIDVYRVNGITLQEALERVVKNSPNSKRVQGVGRGAVLELDKDGAPRSTLWIASDNHLCVLWIADSTPAEPAWVEAGNKVATKAG
ncbi:DUF3558 domain-containing protein [Streptoalloteichus tenebrarius]|uniref:DUF3558 domain-containing protein n=1 Tax=Streptoalloteichus tenebrarius (strain ATCC 17920 / DSM 40477 / JCM 4838 / CBS 697.72 / NBRC 16177 / NCIMB 11028 / NRRL B-12390 / A12253. 1 / ISP 5477) TaxID=1933 RepID=UPI0020A607C6|nr:DUF3558 domain-containing protein [Streptoalloteichus tenebrarius]